MTKLHTRLSKAAKWRVNRLRNNMAIKHKASLVEKHAPESLARPVIFFNASSRLGSMSLNAAYSLLTSWSIRLSGTSIINVYCKQGMSRCIHGTNREDITQKPPCKECIAQSKVNFSHSKAIGIPFIQDHSFDALIENLSLSELEDFHHSDIPLGHICRSSLRWVMRRYHLKDDDATRTLFREYLRSGWNIARQFEHILTVHQPQALVVFNGIVYPEAIARHLAEIRGIRVISHEVNLQPDSAFFTTEEATFRATKLPDNFELTEVQIHQFNEYFVQRTRGQFKMAGVKFWKEIKGLDAEFLETASHFTQLVSVFTNVIFDTSQEHANIIFPHMFAWLDHLKDLVKSNPQTLFVLRAHPDEARPGKSSQESVAEWVENNHFSELPNAVFIGPNQSINSYELIQRSKFAMIYTSTIGMEATLLGTPVICAGRAYYNEFAPAVFPAASMAEYENWVSNFLTNVDKPVVPEEHAINARNFLYYQLYRTSLPFSDFIEEDGAWQGYVKLKKFPWSALKPENSITMQVLHDGILKGKAFILPE
ncbi:MAG: hypothetical protein V2J07_04355 [Anaerolineae bacterium]|jgi:hypothetical protein|nr:hypothetical protein [Anaerolineae bacterium]